LFSFLIYDHRPAFAVPSCRRGMKSQFLVFCAVSVLFCSSVAPCFGINLVLDYTYDTYFKTHATAKATLERAALDISSAITTHLGATTDTSCGASGITAITLDYELAFRKSRGPRNASA